MTNRHTPGPWLINNWPQGDAEIRIGAAGTPRIATVHLRDVSINQQKANAHVIAASPQMLAALRSLLAYHDMPKDEAEYQNALRNARAAIAQAEGVGQ